MLLHHCQYIKICLKASSAVCAGSAKVSQVKTSSDGPKALIIEPSKELAEQTFNNVKQFKKYVDNPKLRCESTQETHKRTHNCLQF